MLNDRDSAVLRSRIYRALAAAFSQPKAETANLYRVLLELPANLQSTETPPDVIRDSESPSLPKLEREYLRLFVGPGHVPCSPYESVYRKDRPDFEKGLVMGPSTADVRRAYLAAGLDISRTYKDLPDHISAEMEFMRFLCAEESRLTEEGNSEDAAKIKKMQREFHKNHIQLWVDDFARCVIHSTTSPYYMAAASALKEFVKSESNYLAEAV